MVSRYADVCEVLGRDEDFTIAEINATPMDRISGPFILGMDRSEQYERDLSILRRCVHDEDSFRIRACVATVASSLISTAASTGRIDVVQGFARPAAVHLVNDYFGVPGPDPATMMRWMRTLFQEAFLNTGANSTIRRAAEQAAAEFHLYTDGLISARKSQLTHAVDVSDDFLTRMIRLQDDGEYGLSDESVRRNIAGIVVGAVDTTSKAITHALDELLRHRDAFQLASRAARAGDVDLVERYMLDALRFNPFNPAQVRHATRDTVIAAGKGHPFRVRAGQTVYLAVMAAMFDPAAIDHPNSLRADRSFEYLHFGHGMHSCFGRRVNSIQIPELAMALLSCRDLRRAAGDDGRIHYDGPFPDRLILEFTPTRSLVPEQV